MKQAEKLKIAMKLEEKKITSADLINVFSALVRRDYELLQQDLQYTCGEIEKLEKESSNFCINKYDLKILIKICEEFSL